MQNKGLYVTMVVRFSFSCTVYVYIVGSGTQVSNVKRLLDYFKSLKEQRKQ